MQRIFIVLFFFLSINIFAQNPKAKDFYDKALKNLAERKSAEANENFFKAIKTDSTYSDAFFKLGQFYESTRNQENALKFYGKAIELKPNELTFTQAYTYIGTRLMRVGNYEKAKQYLSFSLKNSSPNSPIVKQLTKQIEQCSFGIEAQKKSMNFSSVEMGNTINFKNKQYFPVLTADNETLIFTARSDDGDENLYTSQLKEGNWTEPKSISSKINSPYNEGTCSISADGHTLVFTSCDGKDTFGSCDLYISKKVGEEWSTPQNLGEKINSPFWDAQPSLSNDGRILYFSSERPKGYGRKDLWMSELGENENWTKATNLGNTINTLNDEISPFIHANGHTLFFASDGLIGMGGLDLFMTEQKSGIYTKPENLGYPINTYEDQVALFITSDGKKGYYSSDIKSSVKLFQFDIPKELSDKIIRVNVVKGIVRDAQTKKNISAEIELVDLKTNQAGATVALQKIKSDSLSGEYTAVLPNGSQYGLFVSKNNYFFKSLTFDFSEKTDAGGKTINVLLEPIRKDVKEVLNNIFFDSGKFDLRSESFAELDKLQKLLKQNPTLKVEISGHTDNVGKDSENQILSEKRALAVVNYLLNNGTNVLNIRSIGYGSSKPMLPNDSEENRQINRRIEMKIL
ncbi:OmpA family protein [Emticicia sp.]|uniref:OmpA family protein n=1 Tax=Emticicia sp. TaxID=1930953 RepID=UPI003753A7C0